MKALAVLPFLLFACSNEPGVQQKANHARFALSQEPQSFDPLHADDTANQVLQQQVLEGLAEYDISLGERELRPLLAKSWTTPDNGTTWNIQLLDGAQFFDPTNIHNWPNRRRSLQSKDVFASWLRHADPSLNSRSWWAFEGLIQGLDDFRANCLAHPENREQYWKKALQKGQISGLMQVGENQIEVQLQYADPHFPQRLASPYYRILPHENSQSLQPDTPIGTGPFWLKEWRPRQRALFQRDDSWRGQPERLKETGKPYLEQLEFLTVREASTRTAMFEKGEIDRISPQQDSFHRLLPTENRSSFLNENAWQLMAQESPDLTMLCFNMQDPMLGHLPNDPTGNEQRRRLRHAIASAFPKDRWHEVIRNGVWATPALNFFPPAYAPAGSPSFKRSDMDVDSSGITEESPLRLELPGNDAITLAMGDLIARAFTQAGFPTQAIPNTWTAFSTKTSDGTAQIFVRSWVMDWADPNQMLALFYGPNASPGINRSNYKSRAFDELYDQCAKNPKQAQRQSAQVKALELLLKDLPAFPIDHRKGFLLGRRFSRMQPHPFDVYACKDYQPLSND